MACITKARTISHRRRSRIEVTRACVPANLKHDKPTHRRQHGITAGAEHNRSGNPMPRASFWRLFVGGFVHGVLLADRMTHTSDTLPHSSLSRRGFTHANSMQLSKCNDRAFLRFMTPLSTKNFHARIRLLHARVNARGEVPSSPVSRSAAAIPRSSSLGVVYFTKSTGLRSPSSRDVPLRPSRACQSHPAQSDTRQ